MAHYYWPILCFSRVVWLGYGALDVFAVPSILGGRGQFCLLYVLALDMKIGKLYRVTSCPRGYPLDTRDTYVYAFSMAPTGLGRYLEPDEVFMIVDTYKIPGHKTPNDVALIGDRVLLLSSNWDLAAVEIEKTKS